MLPGWFGVGHAITAFKDKALLADMARIWPFFQTMLGNMEMVLAKSDMALASRYAELVQDQEAAQAIFARIREGDRKSVVQVKRVSVRVALGGRRMLQTKKNKTKKYMIKI